MQQIQIFQSSDGAVSLEVSLEQETVWFSLDQMVALFECDKSVISRHIRNVFREGSSSARQLLQKMQQLPPMGRPTRSIT